jgi:ribosome-associated toxin RatA of RatAB toxin-antitoxin module
LQGCTNEISIRGTVPEVVRLAFDLPAWPEFLPHYRWVRVLATEGERHTVEMACRRGGLPLKWRSHLWLHPEEGRMRFLHIGGPARGMEVEWTLTQEGDQVRVVISHDLRLQVPLVRTALGRWVVGDVFVRAVASRTLAFLKDAVEARGTEDPHGQR